MKGKTLLNIQTNQEDHRWATSQTHHSLGGGGGDYSELVWKSSELRLEGNKLVCN